MVVDKNEQDEDGECDVTDRPNEETIITEGEADKDGISGATEKTVRLASEEFMESTSQPELPGYRGETHVQPKFVLKGDTDRNAEKDIIVNAFSQGSFVGIRSLPNALRPDFRKKLYELVLENKHCQSSNSIHTQPSTSKLSYSTEILPGQRYQIPFSGAPRAFTSFTYMSSEYDRSSELNQTQNKAEKKRWVGDADFKVTALPQVPNSAGSFNEFHYAIDPYEYGEVSAIGERKDMLLKRLFGPLRAAGRSATNEQKKILRRECLNRLRKLLHDDWKNVFISCEEDSIGCIMLKFDASTKKENEEIIDQSSEINSRSIQESESSRSILGKEDYIKLEDCYDRDKMIANYVSNFCQRDAISDEFQLRRDTSRWALKIHKKPDVTSTEALNDNQNHTDKIEGVGEWLVFYLIPPWVHYNAIPDALQKRGVSENVKKVLRSADLLVEENTPLMSSRVPFGPQTNAGNLILAHTRTLNRSFKFV